MVSGASVALTWYRLATKLSEYFGEKGWSSKYSCAVPLSKEERFPMSFADDISAIVERGYVFC
jgi:hypothetical protein